MKLIFATSNQNKAYEIARLLPSHFQVLTLSDIGQTEDVPETSNTIEGNALQKANYITEHYNVNCFADDTGLEIEALNMEPGVRSARYAGDHRSDDDNINLVLEKLNTIENRAARFKTVIALNLNGNQHLFEGVVDGVIIREKRGRNGFGYDPIFMPENTGKTFAEMTMDEKNNHSHRARAFAKMVEFLNSLN